MKFLLLNSIFTLFLSCNALADESEICLKNGKIRYLLNNEEVSLNSSYCFNKDRNALFSDDCKSNSNCTARKAAIAKDKKQDLFQSGIGSPGFKLCYLLEGKPQLMEFFDGENWFKLDRCMFNSDKTYIDTGSLISIWSKK